jgi:hypothetical protein
MNEDYQVKNDEIQKTLKDMGTTIGGALPKGWGFTLMLFNFGEGGNPGDAMFYISNAERSTMIESMEEFITKQKEETL